MQRLLTTAAAALGGAALALGMVGPLAPASAETTFVEDGADTTATLNDILNVRLKHTRQAIGVRSTYVDLRKVTDDGGAGTAIYLDTRPRRQGPEFALVSGLQMGTDYQLVRVKDWRFTGRPKTCDHTFSVDWRRNLTRFVVDRDCVGNPARVRVSQRVVDIADPSHPVRDWAPGRRQFSAWASAG